MFIDWQNEPCATGLGLHHPRPEVQAVTAHQALRRVAWHAGRSLWLGWGQAQT